MHGNEAEVEIGPGTWPQFTRDDGVEAVPGWGLNLPPRHGAYRVWHSDTQYRAPYSVQQDGMKAASDDGAEDVQ